MESYNGYSPAERAAKGRARAQALASGLTPGACAMCGDGESKRWLHSEDYSRPYLWTEPAVYSLCDRCHRRVHLRFRNPGAWHAYGEFLSRGWFGREVEGRQIAAFLRAKDSYVWPPRRRRNLRAGSDAWWAQLTLNPESRCAPWARPRP